MQKVIIFSKEVYIDLRVDEKIKFKKIIEDLIRRGNAVIFTSRNKGELNRIKEELDIKYKYIKFYSRDELKRIISINKEKSHYFIMVGNRDVDFTTAVNNKFLYLMPMWTKIKYDKGLKYGIQVNDLKILQRFIDTVNNQNNWFYKLVLDDSTLVYSLISAHTKNWDISKEEKRLVQGFEDLLKKGDITYYEILLYHFLAGIANNPVFKEVDLWGIFPSSGLELNKEMMKFKERARWCMNGRNPVVIVKGLKENNIFLRKKKIEKSHEKSHSTRISDGCSVHFDSIVVNDAYTKEYLRNKKVACIFDDYLTNGNSFETARNILKALGFKKIILVSLGRFNRPYYKQDYEIFGNMYTGDYTYELKHKEFLNRYEIREDARKEVENLHEIFNL